MRETTEAGEPRWLTNGPPLDSPFADESFRVYARDKRQGRPKATASYTVEELEAQDLVGYYTPEARP